MKTLLTPREALAVLVAKSTAPISELAPAVAVLTELVDYHDERPTNCLATIAHYLPEDKPTELVQALDVLRNNVAHIRMLSNAVEAAAEELTYLRAYAKDIERRITWN